MIPLTHLALLGLAGYRGIQLAVHEMIQDRELPEAPEPEQPAGKVLDLMAALQESVDKAKASRGEDIGADAQVHEMPMKKTAPKKTASKKTAVKKTAARKPRRSA